MLLLHDTIEIQTTPDQIFQWLGHFQENYLAWHPDHVKCFYMKGKALEVGSEIYVEEYLHGELHRLKLRITKVVPMSRVEYKAGLGMGGAFIVLPQTKGILFTAEIYMGISIAILTLMFDKVLVKLFSKQIKALEQHMMEEGQNLKMLLKDV